MIEQMSLLIRLILACLFVVQTLPGFAVGSCAAASTGGASERGAASDAVAVCPCCSAADEKPATCADGSAAAACCCANAQPEQPKAPASDSKTDRLQLTAVAIQAFFASRLPESRPDSLRADHRSSTPKRPANPIQSVLCVWVE